MAGPGATQDLIRVQQRLGAFDVDEDTDVDSSDFASFERAFGG